MTGRKPFWVFADEEEEEEELMSIGAGADLGVVLEGTPGRRHPPKMLEHPNAGLGVGIAETKDAAKRETKTKTMDFIICIMSVVELTTN